MRTSPSPEATEQLGAAIAARLTGGETILLAGELGAGKTCFVRGLARGLGIAAGRVKSPSYAILHVHAGGRMPLLHFDAYFVRDEGEFERNGLTERLEAGAVAVVEWGDRFEKAFAGPVLKLRFAVAGESSRTIEAAGGLAARLLPDEDR